jgi:hypothetical protein
VLLIVGAVVVAGILATILWKGTAWAVNQIKILYAKASRGSGKENASDVPSYARGAKKKAGESSAAATERIMKQNRRSTANKGPGSEYSKIKKYFDRHPGAQA